MTEISSPPADAAVRRDTLALTDLYPLGHPSLGRDALATAYAVDALLDSSHPDDVAATFEVKARFREHDSLWVPETLPGLERMHRDVLWWMSDLNYPDLEAFLRWNVEHQALQQERLQADVPVLQDITMAHVAELIGHGLFQPRTLDQMEQVLARTTYHAWDSFGSGSHMAAGLYVEGTWQMALSNQYSGGARGLDHADAVQQKTHTHESLHGLRFLTSGGLGVILPETGDTASTQWVDEAFVEHSAQVALTGRPELLSPSARESKPAGSNVAGREVLSAISRAAQPEIPIILWAEAFAEPQDADRQPARKELHRRLGALSARIAPEYEGRDIACAIGAELSAVPVMRASRVLRRWQERIAA